MDYTHSDEIYQNEQVQEEPQEELFQLKKFLTFFEKREIEIKGVYMLEDRVVFIHIFLKRMVKDVFLYVSSKFNIAAEGVFKFPKYEIESSEDSLSGQDKIVYSFFESQLERLEKSPIKYMWMHKKRLVYITRHNELDTFNLSTIAESGFYYIMEWEYFFKHHQDVQDDLENTENNLMKSTLSLEPEVEPIKVVDKMFALFKERPQMYKRLKERSQRVTLVANNLKGDKFPDDLLRLGHTIQQDILSQCFKIHTLNSEIEQINKIL
jgi:hypothetical protein